MEYCLTTHNLTKRYRKFTALDNVSLQVKRGAIYGLVGRNGAGKTTIIRVVTGLQEPTEGDYTLFDAEYGNEKALARIRRRIGAIVETPALYNSMSAKENLYHQAILLGLPSTSKIDELLKLVGLEDAGKKRVSNFSLGMRQRLGIALALIGDPDLIILDEPTNGLDPQGIVEIRELILKLNKEHGVSFVISSHILGELSKLATDYGFIEKGRLICEMTAEQLEEKCRKKIILKVDGKKSLSSVLDKAKLEYKMLSPDECEIYGPTDIQAVLTLLTDSKLSVVHINECDEDLETFFLNLIGTKQ